MFNKKITSNDLLEEAYLRSGDSDIETYQYRVNKLKEAAELKRKEEENEKHLEI